MKHALKKGLSAILVVLLLLTSAPMSGFANLQSTEFADLMNFDLGNIFSTTANAEEGVSANKKEMTEILPINSYSAEAFSQINNYLGTYSNKADNFNYYEYAGSALTSSQNTYLLHSGMDMKTIAENYVNTVSKDQAFIGAYSIWKIAGYIDKPIDFVYDVGGITSAAYYETVLLKCLECELKNDAVIDLVYKDSVKNSIKFLKSFYKACEDFSKESYVNAIKKPLDEIEYDYLAEYSKEWVESNVHSKLGILYQEDGVDFISDFLQTASSLENYAEKLASLVAVSNLSDSIADYMKILADNADGHPELKQACNEVAAIISDAFGQTMTTAIYDGVTSIGKHFFSNYLNKAWKDGILKILNLGALSSGAKLVNGVLLGITIGRAIGDICFSTSKTLDSYEMSICLVNFMNLQRNTLSSLLSSYDGSADSAVMLCEAVDLLYQTYAVGSDLINTAIDVLKQFCTGAEYKSAKEGIGAEKSYYNNQYNLIKSSYQLSAINNNASWIILNDGSLLIIGKGAVTTAPWKSRAGEISQIYISSGITSLGDNIFADINLENKTIVMEHVSTVTGRTFSNAPESCNLVFLSNVYFDASNGYLDTTIYVKANVYVYGNLEMVTYGAWSLNSIYCMGDCFISDGEINFNKKSVIAGTLTFSQWSTVKVNTGAELICNNLVGRAWAYADAYRTAIVNNSKLIVATLTSGFINYSSSNSSSELSSNRISGSISVSSGTVSIYGTSSFSYSADARIKAFGNKYTFSGSGTLKSLDVYASQLTLSGSVNVTSYIDFHGNDVVVNNPIILTNSAALKEGSNYKHIRMVDGYYLSNNIVADIIEIDRNLYITSGNRTLTGSVKGTNALSYGISVSSGASLTIDGDIYGEKNFMYSSEAYINGKFKVTGTASGYLYFSNTGTFEMNDISLSETGMEGGKWFISGDVNNLNFVESASVVFCGNEPQQISASGTLGICEITNHEGVVFTNKVVSTKLFNHNQNSFTLKSGGTFVDYDGDGLKDNVDPLPKIATYFDTSVLDDLSVSVSLISGDNFEDYYWEIYDVADEPEIVIPTSIGGIPVKSINNAFDGNSTVKTLIIYPSFFDESDIELSESITTIKGYTGTNAEKLALENGLTFQTLGSVSDIEIATQANKTAFSINQDFSADGLIINVYTDDGECYQTDKYAVSGYDSSLGYKTISVVYAGKTITYEVFVTEYNFSYISDNELSITGYYGDDLNLEIPSSINGNIVKQISSLSYLDIETLTIPASVSSISSSAFSGTYSLSSIVVDPNNDNYCSDDGILYNYNKTTLVKYPSAKAGTVYTIPETVTSVGAYAMEDCTNIEELTISENVSSLGNRAFGYCSNLKVVNYNAVSCSTPTSISLITSNVPFRNCNMMETVIIGDNVNSIPKYLFYNCSSISEVIISDNSNLKTIDNSAFYYCDNLSYINIPDTVTQIGSNAFKNCKKLNGVILPASLKSLGASAFSGCSSLTSINVPETITSISDNTFANCTSLERIEVPYQVTTIGATPFAGCNKLTLWCYNNSVAYEYALENSINYKIIEVDSENLVVNGVQNTLILDSEYQLSTEVSPIYTDETIVWSSSDSKVFTVTNTGLITAKGVGEAILTVSSSRGSVSKTFDIKVIGLIEDADKKNLYHISSVDDMFTLSTMVNNGVSFAGKVVQLDNDIDLRNVDWTPIGIDSTNVFSGVFDGKNHTISGLNYVSTSNTYSGLFGYIKTGGVKDLTVEGSVSGISRVGMIAGCILDSALYNCKAIGEVKRTGSGNYGYVGGLVGTALHSVIINCAAETDIAVDFSSSIYYASVGGIAGVASVSNSVPQCILNSYCRGDITVSGNRLYSAGSPHYYVGGIVGYLKDDAVNNYYYGQIIDIDTDSIKEIGYAFGHVAPEFTTEDEYNGIGTIVVSNNYYPEGETAIASIDSGDYDMTEWTTGITNERFSMLTGEGSLINKLNDNTSAVEEIIVAHRDILSDSTWAELVERIDGDSFTVSSWKIGADNLPVNYEVECYEHIESDWITDIEATCTKEGSKYTYCLICYEIVATSTIDKAAHTFNQWNETKAATCTDDGSESSTCSVCKTVTETRTIDKSGHDFDDEWTVDKDATCTKEGSKSHHCSRCEEKSDVTAINKIAHDYADVIIESTCINDGSITYTCTSCGDSYSEVITATGHIDNDNNKKCDNCDYSFDFACDHLCHKTGFLGFFAKIAIFFWKLFGMNPVCKCGVAHY